MTDQDTIQLLELLLDWYKNGKSYTLEYLDKNEWIEIPKTIEIFDYSDLDYLITLRRKPKPEYVPFEGAELISLIGKSVRGKIDTQIYIISTIQFEGCNGKIISSIQIGDVYFVEPEALLKHFTFEDGAPCGKIKP